MAAATTLLDGRVFCSRRYRRENPVAWDWLLALCSPVLQRTAASMSGRCERPFCGIAGVERFLAQRQNPSFRGCDSALDAARWKATDDILRALFDRSPVTPHPAITRAQRVACLLRGTTANMTKYCW